MKRKGITILLIALFATILWGFVSLGEEYFYKVQAKINFVDLPEGYGIASVSAQTVEINIRGKGMDLAGITLGPDRTFNIPVNSTSKGQDILLRNLLEYNSWLSSNLTIEDIYPVSINYQLDEVTSKSIKIEPNLLINYKDGSGLTSEITLDPDTVVITGPKSVVESTMKIKTEFQEINDADGIITARLNLEQKPNLRYTLNYTNLQFEAQQIVDKVFKNIPVETKGVPGSRELQLFPGRIDIVLRGGIKILGAINESDLSASINFTQALIDTTGSLEPRIKFPNHTIFIRSIPNRLEYIIKRY